MSLKTKAPQSAVEKGEIPRDNHDDHILREISRSNEKALPLINLKDELSSFGVYGSSRLHEKITCSKMPVRMNVFIYSERGARESGLADADKPGDIYINAFYKENQLPHELKHAADQGKGTNKIELGKLSELNGTHRLMLNAAVEEGVAILFSIVNETEEPKAKDKTTLLLERVIGVVNEKKVLNTQEKVDMILERMIERSSKIALGLYDAIAEGTLDKYLEKFEGDKTPTVATGIYSQVHELGTALFLVRCISPGGYKSRVDLYHEAIMDLMKEHQSGTSLDFAEKTMAIIKKDSEKGKAIRTTLVNKIDWVELEVAAPETLAVCQR